MTHVGVDEQRAFAHLRKHSGKIRGEPTAPLTPFRAGNRQCLVAGVVEPSKSELTTQSTQGLHLVALGFVGSYDVGPDTVFAPARKHWIVELLRQREINVVLRKQFELNATVAQPPPICPP